MHLLNMQHKTIVRIGLIVFLFKNLNVRNLSAATENLRIDYTFFVKPTCFFINSEATRQ